MTGQPNKEFIFFREVQIPNPGPRFKRVGSGVGCRVGEEPVVATFSSINSIFVVRPNKSVVYGIIESDIGTVDVVCNLGRKRGVKNVSGCLTKVSSSNKNLTYIDKDIVARI